MTESPPIEITHDFQPRPLRAAILDFDGTLSLLRRNWQQVMIPMMLRILQQTGSDESDQQLEMLVKQFVTQLTGKQTIYQMIQLAEEVQLRGGQPQQPLEYKQQYHQLLMQQVEGRLAGVRSGEIPVDSMRVPGSLELLECLRDNGLELYLASGTDLVYVEQEVKLLGLDQFFGKHIYGAVDDYKNFSKAMIIEQMIDKIGLEPEQLLGFGDGYVEIEQVRKVGGLAVGVASNELTREGIDPWKRERLTAAGANMIIPDYRDLAGLMNALGLAAPRTS
jgi:phosphoglycolate phosphatase-like HAD superfamily hydrolase